MAMPDYEPAESSLLALSTVIVNYIPDELTEGALAHLFSRCADLRSRLACSWQRPSDTSSADMSPHMLAQLCLRSRWCSDDIGW